MGHRVPVSASPSSTGVDFNHPDLDGQVAEKVDLTGSGMNGEDDIHGTAVAGIIGALSEKRARHRGRCTGCPPARLARLLARAVRCHRGSVQQSHPGRALDTAILRDSKVVNLGLTGPPDPWLGTC